MRVRFRRNFLIKLGLIVISLLLVGPLLLHLISGQDKVGKDGPSKYDLLKDRVPHHDGEAGPGLHQDNVVANPLAGGGQGGDEGAGGPHVALGPEAVFKKGILGNFEPRNEETRHGPGEYGNPVFATMEERKDADRTVREYGFNIIISDKISMDRAVKDTRMDECKFWQLPEDLPSASVIIVFHNEGWSPLMRTVHSVINTTPANLLKEVVMVDDFSDKEHLKGKLEEYIKRFNGKVKLYRNSERLGLILTRTRGAELSTGEVIVFLDAHCECNKNWLPPLLSRIKYDR